MKEELSSAVHDTWTRWMHHMFTFCTFNEDGSVTIPKEKMARWWRQMRTDYNDLPEDEKDSDRAEADRYLAILDAYMDYVSSFVLDPGETGESIIGYPSVDTILGGY